LIESVLVDARATLAGAIARPPSENIGPRFGSYASPESPA
jgi:hypothetical protein